MLQHKLAIVAAMKFEVEPLVGHWQRRRKEFEGREFEFFERGGTVVVCGGIGTQAARRAAEAMVRLYRPDVLMSVGFAGALQPGLSVGQVLTPRTVIDAGDSSRTDTGEGEGILVSFGGVADARQKNKLHQAYAAQAVDMEAAAVAKAAEVHGVPFRVCKTISDASDVSVPGSEFIAADGSFQTAKYAVHAALRPWLWRSTVRMARNCSLAATQLSAALAVLIEEEPDPMQRLETAVGVKS